MRIACVLIPRFPLAIELLARPELRGRSVIVGGAPDERQTVVECSPEAERTGVRRDMPLREALTRCRTAVFLEARPSVYAAAFEQMLTALEQVSPIVEADAVGCAFVDLSGLPGVGDPAGEQRLAESLQRAVHAAVGLIPCAGIADTRFAAWVAANAERGTRNAERDGPQAPPCEVRLSAVGVGVARMADSQEMHCTCAPPARERMSLPQERSCSCPHEAPSSVNIVTHRRAEDVAGASCVPRSAFRAPRLHVHVVPPGEAVAFLTPLPVERLPVSEEMRRRLRWLGLRTAGDLAALPRATLAAQFGPEGALAWDLVHGEGGGPLIPRRHQPRVAGSVEFPQPVSALPAIMAAARHLLARMLRRPECAGRSVRGLAVTATLSTGHAWQRLVTFHEPVADQERMLRALAAKLDVAFPAAVVSLELCLRDLCGETGLQPSMFSAHAHLLHSLDNALERLQARFGRPLVMKIVGVEPWSRIPERQYALIACEPSTSRSQ